jgi:hypothetical protein
MPALKPRPSVDLPEAAAGFGRAHRRELRAGALTVLFMGGAGGLAARRA